MDSFRSGATLTLASGRRYGLIGRNGMLCPKTADLTDESAYQVSESLPFSDTSPCVKYQFLHTLQFCS